MVVRANRDTDEAFYGCTRYPSCRGTRPMPGGDRASGRESHQPKPRARPSRPIRYYRLSAGGRPRSLPDYAELIVARFLGRNLGPLEGGVVQLLALVMFGALFYWAFASGFVVRIIEPFAQWMASQMHFGPTPAPGP